MNEELVTVNSELQAKVQQLNQVENDMRNLLESTGIGTIFLDNDLSVIRFTPEATRVINLIPSDIGRPIKDIVLKIDYDRLFEDADEVRRTAVPKEIEVSADEGDWYLARIIPYRTTEDMIEGVVVTFTDISETKKAASEAARLIGVARRYAEGIVETVRDKGGERCTIETFLFVSSVSVNVDIYLFSKVMENQIVNAEEAMQDGGLLLSRPVLSQSAKRMPFRKLIDSLAPMRTCR